MMDVPLFVYLPGRGDLDRLHSLVINNTARNIHKILLDICFLVRMAYHMVGIYVPF